MAISNHIIRSYLVSIINYNSVFHVSYNEIKIYPFHIFHFQESRLLKVVRRFLLLKEVNEIWVKCKSWKAVLQIDKKYNA